MKLNIRAFSLTFGFSCGIFVFILTWFIILFVDIDHFNFFHIVELTKGYSPTPLGSFVASIIAFADGLIFGMVFAWVYNLLVDHFVNEDKN